MNNRQKLEAQRRNPGLYMNERDLSELYSYLEFFTRIYSSSEKEVGILLHTIRELYALETGIAEESVVLRALKNPRNAGRQGKYASQDREKILSLRREGLSVRAIADITNIPKSTVQRILHS